MGSIIETLYINLDRPQAPNGPELEKVKGEYAKMCDIIQAQYGPDFLDRFEALWDQLNQRNWQTEFSLGFRACAQLMLETLGN